MRDDLGKRWLERDQHGDINPHLGRCLVLKLERGGWREDEALQAVAHGDREMIPGILFALSCVAIVCECHAAASSSQCAGEG